MTHAQWTDDIHRAMHRRAFLRSAGVLVAGFGVAACTKSGSSATPTSGSGGTTSAGSLNDIAAGVRQITAQSANDVVNPGPQIFTFALIDSDNSLVKEPAQVYLGTTPSEKALGPFAATWYDFTGYAATDDRSPESPLTGVYVSTIDVPPPPSEQAVVWSVLATSQVNGAGVGGTSVLQVSTADIVAAVGSQATSVRSPVATSPAKIAEICTRVPVCPLHSLSIDEALGNGKPSVINFGTPLLCQVQLCGPVLDEVMLVARDVGGKANVIHIEEFLPGKDLKPPAATLENVAPTFKAWGFESEPWVIVVDRHGVIRGRLGPGASVAPEIMSVLQPLL